MSRHLEPIHPQDLYQHRKLWRAMYQWKAANTSFNGLLHNPSLDNVHPETKAAIEEINARLAEAPTLNDGAVLFRGVEPNAALADDQ